MFPEYRQLITQMKSENAHFSALFQRHNDLDQEIQNMEDGVVPTAGVNIEVLKKEKLQLKDKLYGLLRAADQKAG
ncbi:YdcH family protein [Achromobacter sp. ES-001]|uniref:YdcH family protein n=1 Tax=Achromobacter sp. ES-001 TaxID=2860286 RepID=UPI001C63DC6A|nr:YdcH family protein [Achromobacter sp. ES-001]QYJ20150.1 YdcH family protein [Achromobacter sp. ES-001]